MVDALGPDHSTEASRELMPIRRGFAGLSELINTSAVPNLLRTTSPAEFGERLPAPVTRFIDTFLLRVGLSVTREAETGREISGEAIVNQMTEDRLLSPEMKGIFGDRLQTLATHVRNNERTKLQYADDEELTGRLDDKSRVEVATFLADNWGEIQVASDISGNLVQAVEMVANHFAHRDLLDVENDGLTTALKALEGLEKKGKRHVLNEVTRRVAERLIEKGVNCSFADRILGQAPDGVFRIRFTDLSDKESERLVDEILAEEFGDARFNTHSSNNHLYIAYSGPKQAEEN